MGNRLKEARGCLAIPFTPFSEDGRIDEADLEREIEWIVGSQAAGIAVPMMVSEFSTLSEEERKLMIRVSAQVNAGRRALIANVAAPNALLAASYAQYAQDMGADAVIAMVPWDGALDQGGAADYFRAIASSVTVPVILQNTKLGNGFFLSAESVAALCDEVPNLSWVKQEVPPAPLTLEKLGAMHAPGIEGIISGFGGFYTPYDYYGGANATISSCQFAALIQKVWDFFFEGKEEEARHLHNRLLPSLQAETVYGWKYGKEIMVLRGVLKNSACRNLTEPFSKNAMREIRYLFGRVEELERRYLS